MNEDLFIVTPMAQEFSLEPGKEYSGKVTIINPASATSDFEYEVYVAPYGVIGENYNADFVANTSYNVIAEWVTINDDTGSIHPNSSHDVEFTINVPDNAPGGGQYAAIMIGKGNKEGDSENVVVENRFEIASLIYADVKGETVHKGEIKENNVPGFVANAPINLGVLVNNEGNVHDYAFITITAENVFTGEVIVGTDERNGQYSEIVMPETERYIQRSIEEGLPELGVVHVKQEVSYNGHYSVVEQNVIICPIWFLFLLFATFGAFVFTVITIVKARKKRKAHVLKSS